MIRPVAESERILEISFELVICLSCTQKIDY
jgi:hypothetical protein